jgi:hypothetical protein
LPFTRATRVILLTGCFTRQTQQIRSTAAIRHYITKMRFMKLFILL